MDCSKRSSGGLSTKGEWHFFASVACARVRTHDCSYPRRCVRTVQSFWARRRAQWLPGLQRRMGQVHLLDIHSSRYYSIMIIVDPMHEPLLRNDVKSFSLYQPTNVCRSCVSCVRIIQLESWLSALLCLAEYRSFTVPKFGNPAYLLRAIKTLISSF